jgi:hypothetical protein
MLIIGTLVSPAGGVGSSTVPSHGRRTRQSLGNRPAGPFGQVAALRPGELMQDGAAAGQEASWRERALNTEDAVKAAHAEIRAQRARIGQLLGQLRDAERELTDDTGICRRISRPGTWP